MPVYLTREEIRLIWAALSDYNMSGGVRGWSSNGHKLHHSIIDKFEQALKCM
jgi:hypothetical protein